MGGGPVSPRLWGVTTQKANRVYVHVLDWNNGDALWLPLQLRVVSAKFLKDGSAAPVTQAEGGVLIKAIPQSAADGPRLARPWPSCSG